MIRGRMAHKLRLQQRLVWGASALIGLAVLYWALMETGALSILADKQALREWVNQLGLWGPLAIIGLMVGAIVMSPIPSGPIAMVAGATYGPFWGTLYVVIGAEAGALIAFCIARLLGYEAANRWSHIRPVLTWLGKERSQTGIMLIVFCIPIGAVHFIRCRQLRGGPHTACFLAILGGHLGWRNSDSVHDRRVRRSVHHCRLQGNDSYPAFD